MRLRGAELLVKSLEEHDVEYIFGIPGHGNMEILDALYDSNIKFILTRHEQGAAHIADGYSRISGKVGVCCSSVGPGAANMIEAVAVANAASSSVLMINGGIISKMSGKGQLQETSRSDSTDTDQQYIQALSSFTKRYWQINNNYLIPNIIDKAFYISRISRPGSCAIEYPWDLQAEYLEIDEKNYKNRFKRIVDNRILPNGNIINKASKLLANAKFPLILAGNGAVISNAWEEVLKLAETLNAPVATTFMSKGIIPEDNKLSLGMVGWLGHPAAHKYIRDYADYILAVGVSFSDESTSWWTEGYPFVKENKFIYIDIEPKELGKNYPAELSMWGDARETLNAIILKLYSKNNINNKNNRLALIKEIKEENTLKAEFYNNIKENSNGMQGMVVSKVLREILPKNNLLIAVDTGFHAHFFSAFFETYEPNTLLNPGSWTPMGWSPAAIIGAKLAAPNKTCISISGDGGFYMMCQEIATAVEYETPVIWIIFNNRSLGVSS
ncbi:MAG: thiamine pyrophosphate-binding protein [Actinobacteria bacterium]|nr:thiamine pyrophosphate-binding protein [Actinomycetota bacterium]